MPTVPENVLLKRLQERRLHAVHEARAIAERAAAGDSLSAEDEAALKRANEDIDRYKALIDQEIARVQDERDIDDSIKRAYAKVGTKSEEREAVPSLADKMRADLEASKRGETRSNGVYVPLPAETRAVTKATTDVPIPTTLVSALYETLFDDSAILGMNPTILRTQSGEAIKLPKLTGLGAISQADAQNTEGGTIVKTGDAAFAQVELNAYKYAQIMQVSRELIEDGTLDIEALMGRVLGRNMANYVGYDFTLGSGSSLPRGISTLVKAGTTTNCVKAVVGAAGLPSRHNEVMYRPPVVSALPRLAARPLPRLVAWTSTTNTYATCSTATRP